MNTPLNLIDQQRVLKEFLKRKESNMPSDTPISDNLEETRRLLGRARTDAYGDALAKLKELERENNKLREEVSDVSQLRRMLMEIVDTFHIARCSCTTCEKVNEVFEEYLAKENLNN